MRWAIADISDLDRELLHGVELPVADPGDHLLSLIDGTRITIDDDAPAFDYDIDRALRDDDVFTLISEDVMQWRKSGSNRHRMDLLTLVMDESGHVFWRQP